MKRVDRSARDIKSVASTVAMMSNKVNKTTEDFECIVAELEHLVTLADRLKRRIEAKLETDEATPTGLEGITWITGKGVPGRYFSPQH